MQLISVTAPLCDCGIQEYIAHKKQRPLRTLQEDYAQGPTVVLGGRAVSYERGAPVGKSFLVG